MLKIAIPSMVGMLAVALYNTFDSIFVGQVSGDEALTGLSNFLPTEFMFFSQPIVSASVGASSIISGFMGKKVYQELLHRCYRMHYNMDI
ncbi:MATE_efflux family protein [Hexamita inflata]|uniref:MATE efflux family protein n=1 Tax=Hexamita inflata TaxID=28002 RepID=A0AA86THK8_9EUKA|nr:MATE efflux family protein [Hexamita inflata]